ncbi:Subtilase family protein [Pustulibacterium marinum]|uniref:Subtilase family protein n=1 Tax=Pustulibacterium marinum TaxID=1224947 RepID=A0A1I7GXF7_9FLAO|nr:S8 family serine peptidase [Pustulibacterium marinum]SFU53129.1 Subtilase family protein [Pustulibacterium marinum]
MISIAIKIKGFENLPYDDTVNYYLRKESKDWSSFISKYPNFILKPRITSVPSKKIKTIQDETKRLTVLDNINLLSYYTLYNVDENDIDLIFNELHNVNNIEPLYWETSNPIKVLSSGNEIVTTEPLYSQQLYLHNQSGINIDHVRNIDGNRGEYLNIKIIEEGVFIQHQDFFGLNLSTVGNNTNNDGVGTAVASIIAAQDNGFGMMGITPSLSNMQIFSPSSNGGKLGALIYAIITSHDNSLILISDQFSGFNGQPNMPYEVAEDLRDAIKLAIARDIIIIQSAGDGGLNLDEFEDYLGRRIFDIQSADYDKSNSIMVAASKYDSIAKQHTKADFTNYGTCVSGFAQGEDVLVGTRDATSALPYYGLKSGTALSAAIVAGSILSFKGMVLSEKTFNFKMRMLLQIWSFCCIDGVNVSNMPKMNKFYSFLKDVVDIYSRDYIGDTGNRNITSKLQSPDIIISERFIVDPQAEFGTGSGKENKFLNVNVEYGQDNYCYVRLLNRSANTALSNIVNLYYNNASPLASPKSWKLIGQAFVPKIEPGVITVSPAIRWASNKLPKKGHYCFIVLIDNVFDQTPNPYDIHTSKQFLDFIKNNNNAIWRNFNVVDNNPNNSTHPSREINETDFVLDFFYNEELSLVVNSDIPSSAILQFEFPDEMSPYMECNTEASQYRANMKILKLRTPCRHTYIIKNKILNIMKAAPFNLQYYIPRNERESEYKVELIQYYKDEEIGRVTWSIKSISQDN